MLYCDVVHIHTNLWIIFYIREKIPENMEFFTLEHSSHVPIYRQLAGDIKKQIAEGKLAAGSQLPSINQIADSYSISRDTVKKAYAMLRKEGLVDSTQGKGFFITATKDVSKLSVLLLFDKLSPLKQVFFQTFTAKVGKKAELTVRFHNQDVDLLEHYLDEVLDHYDYYLISPHFQLEKEVQNKAISLLKRIPNRKLILFDRNIPELVGNYGSVYQDYNQDIYVTLGECVDRLRDFTQLNVISVPDSLYHSEILDAVRRFSKKYRIRIKSLSRTTPNDIRKNEAYLILNSQLDIGLKEMVLQAWSKGYTIGRDIGIISYNESPLCELVLNGLTTVSTDFSQMGEIAAEMVLTGHLRKVKCDFRLYPRATF